MTREDSAWFRSDLSLSGVLSPRVPSQQVRGHELKPLALFMNMRIRSLLQLGQPMPVLPCIRHRCTVDTTAYNATVPGDTGTAPN